jgi:hypothetical protein
LILIRLAAGFAAYAISPALFAQSTAGDAFPKQVQTYFKNYCATCHASKIKTANLDLEQYLDEKAALAAHDVWDRALRKIRAGEMPPKGGPQPKPEMTEVAVAWLESRIEHHDRTRKTDPGRVTARRLNRAEYNNTIRDLFLMDLKPANDFPLDDSGYGFDNIGDVLTVSPVLVEKYLAAAERIIRNAVLPEPPRRVIVERYEPERSGSPQSTELPITGAFASRHRFPVEAEYEFRVNVKLREGQTTRPHEIVLLLDGKSAARFSMPAGGLKRFYDFRMPVKQGFAEVGAGFLVASEEERPQLFFDNVEIRGPYNAKPPEPTAAYKQIFICGQAKADQTSACARQIISRFGRRAWRRPITPAETERLARFYDTARKDGFDFDQSVAFAIKAVLVSPQFLFRIERDENPNDPSAVHPVSQFELASRLSYFTWSSMPDEELLTLAEKGELRKPAVLEAQVRRMIADPKSSALAENFAGQWLELRNLEAARPDPRKFPTFDRTLRESMYKESVLFFEHVMRDDKTILDFIDGQYSFLNERLARHYGIPGVKGREFRRVELDGTQRSGVLTHGSVLTITSYPIRTSPVLRGLWVLENFLGAPPPPPPANVEVNLKEDEIGKSNSLRQQLEKHRADPACGVCHNRMDAIGFGFENYSPVGAWREKDGEIPLDSAGVLPGNKAFSNPAELKKILREDSESFAHCFAEKMLTYALGRGLEAYDRPALRKISRGAADQEYRFSSIIMGIVNSAPFQMRRGDPGRAGTDE